MKTPKTPWPAMVVLWQSVQPTIRWSLVQTLVKDCLNPPSFKMPAFADQKVHMKDPARVQQIVDCLISGGPKKLQVITDFDMTLTRFSNNGKRCSTCHNAIESCNLMTEEIKKQMAALKSKFYPIEINPNLSAEEKIPFMVNWWSKSHDLMVDMQIRKEQLAKVVQESDIQLRDGHTRFFEALHQLDVSVFIFSAGVGDILEHVLNNAGAMRPNVHIVSNYMDFNEEGVLQGFKGELIHTYNKNEGARSNAGYFERQRDCTNVILMGDSMGDVRMADGVPHVENKLTIGFLNDKVEESLEKYMDLYDVVLVRDETLDLVNSILEELQKRTQADWAGEKSDTPIVV
ncbi:cytosolic 5'-nucleotidase 3-like isoform X1 [Petromyzon marinus]|uniref:5'-nucleotidase n=3 Tax=Petromyzon marinus TaxID=7757 RepID=A0AAJ7SY66_PETMA|nr:cytosolic 5'-nucleotidase 3-like isoform X1 [Petromyzon marinus]